MSRRLCDKSRSTRRDTTPSCGGMDVRPACEIVRRCSDDSSAIAAGSTPLGIRCTPDAPKCLLPAPTVVGRASIKSKDNSDYTFKGWLTIV